MSAVACPPSTTFGGSGRDARARLPLDDQPGAGADLHRSERRRRKSKRTPTPRHQVHEGHTGSKQEVLSARVPLMYSGACPPSTTFGSSGREARARLPSVTNPELMMRGPSAPPTALVLGAPQPPLPLPLLLGPPPRLRVVFGARERLPGAAPMTGPAFSSRTAGRGNSRTSTPRSASLSRIAATCCGLHRLAAHAANAVEGRASTVTQTWSQ